MTQKFQDIKELHKDTLAFAVHNALEKITVNTEGESITQEQQIAEALIAKAKTGNTTAANIIIKLNKSYQERVKYLRQSEEYLRKENDGALPDEILEAMDACDRNITIAKYSFLFRDYKKNVDEYIKVLQSGSSKKDLKIMEEKMCERYELLCKFLNTELQKNLKVPFYELAEKRMKQETKELSGILEKKEQAKREALDWKIYELFLEEHGIYRDEEYTNEEEDEEEIPKEGQDESESITCPDESLQTDQKTVSDTEQPEEVKLTQNPNKDRDSRERLPVLTELSSLKDVCKVLHKLTRDEDFNKVPNTSQQLIFLMNKLSGENGNKIWSALQDDEVFTFKRALGYLRNHLNALQEKECEEKTKKELQKIVTLNRI